MNSLDILICVHSRSQLHDSLLRRALQSLVDQTYNNIFTVVIVKDSCWQQTDGIISSFKDKLLITDVEHAKRGLASAKNYGLGYCFGDWVGFLDGDDKFHPEKLDKQMAFIKQNPEYDIVATQAWDVYNPGDVNEEITENCFKLGQYMSHREIIARLPYENCLAHGSIIMKRQALEDLGGYPETEQCLGKEDYCLWKLAAEKKYRFWNLPERLLYYSMGTSVER